MLAQSLSLAFLAFLLGVLPLVAVLGDPLLALRWATIPAAAALAFGAWAQVKVIRVNVQREVNRLQWRVTPPPPVVSPVPAPNNTLEQPLHASRSVVYNANGQSGQLSLYPASNELVAFLDACVRISSADALRFPPVLDLKHIGIPYEQQDAMFALLGDAVIRKNRRPTLIKNGYNLGDLRRMAAGG